MAAKHRWGAGRPLSYDDDDFDVADLALATRVTTDAVISSVSPGTRAHAHAHVMRILHDVIGHARTVGLIHINSAVLRTRAHAFDCLNRI